MSLDTNHWRSLFSYCDEVVYLNHASECPLPRGTVHALREAAAKKAAPFRLGLDDYLGLPRRCREKIATLIGAHSDEIALTSSTTYGVNVVAAALADRMAEGDEVVLWRGEFPSGVYPWLNQEKNGIRVRIVGAGCDCVWWPRYRPGGAAGDVRTTCGDERDVDADGASLQAASGDPDAAHGPGVCGKDGVLRSVCNRDAAGVAVASRTVHGELYGLFHCALPDGSAADAPSL